MLGAQLLEIGEAADVPQALDRIEIAAARAHFHVARQVLEHRDIDRLRRCAQHRLRGRLREVGQKLVERAETRGWIAPEQAGERREMMRSEEHTSELQSLMRISYAVFCLKKKT